MRNNAQASNNTKGTVIYMKKDQNKKLSLLQKQLIIILAIIAILAAVTVAVWQTSESGEGGKKQGYFEFMYSLITGGSDDEAAKKSNEPKYDADGDLLGIQDRPYIYDVIPMENVATIEIQNVDAESGEKRNFAFYMDPVAKSLILAGREMLSFDKEKLSYLYVNTCNMLSMMKVENPSEDLSQYGLPGGVSDNMFKVTKTDGTAHTIYIGDKLPTGAAYYCKSADKPHIYVIDTMIEQCVLASPDDFIVPMLCPPIAQEKMYEIQNIKIVTNGELLVSLEKAPENDTDSDDGVAFSHIMTYPGGYTVSQAEVDTILMKLANFQGSSVAEADLFGIYKTPSDNTNPDAESDGNESAEDAALKATLEKYGLTKPSREIHYTLDGKDYKIIFGNKTEDGKSYYAMNMTQYTICVVPCEDVAFIDYELTDYVDEYIFQMNIDNLESIDVGTRKSKEKFLLSGKGAELVVKKSSDGGIVDTKSFRQFYIDVLLVTMTGKAEQTDRENEVLSYTFTTRDGRKYEYKFYDISTTKVFYTVNGAGEFYVNRDSVNKVINNFDKLMAGEKFMSEALGG